MTRNGPFGGRAWARLSIVIGGALCAASVAAAEPPAATGTPGGRFVFVTEYVFGSGPRGAIVTGEVVSGTVKVGDAVALRAAAIRTTVARIERDGAEVQQAVAGD